MGRGSSKAGNGRVSYDRWGAMIHDQPIYETDADGNRTIIGYINDENYYVYDNDVQTITKKRILSDIDDWRMDDGTYGDEDTSILIAYKDGTVVDANDLNGKAYKKSGIIGASLSTADFEEVWGGSINRRTGKMDTWTTSVWDDNGDIISEVSNSYNGYKAVGTYKMRTRTTYNNPNGRGGYKTKHEIIRRSTVKKY